MEVTLTLMGKYPNPYNAVIILQFAVIDLQNAHLLWNDRLPFLRVVVPPWSFKIVYGDILALEHVYALKIRL